MEFTEGALEVAADESLKKKSGARVLRSIIENVLLGVMYELPTLKHVVKCIIDADVVKGLKDPILLTESGDIVELPIAEEKSA